MTREQRAANSHGADLTENARQPADHAGESANPSSQPASLTGSEGAEPARKVGLETRFGVPVDREADERLRADLIAITEAERRALNDAGHFIAASSDLPGPQRLASAVLNVANRGGTPARPRHHEGTWAVVTDTGECGCECSRCFVDDECVCPDCTYDHDHSRRGLVTSQGDGAK